MKVFARSSAKSPYCPVGIVEVSSVPLVGIGRFLDTLHLVLVEISESEVFATCNFTSGR